MKGPSVAVKRLLDYYSFERRRTRLSDVSGLRFSRVRFSVFTIRMISSKFPTMLIIFSAIIIVEYSV